MKLRIERREFSATATIGVLYVDGVFQCYTLEDTDRKLEAGGQKVHGKTAIPRGKYRLVIDYSQRFKKPMPHILDVPKFEGIRIHTGNSAEDTEGCVIVGGGHSGDRLINSRVAFDALMHKLETAEEMGEEIWIEVA